MQASVVRVVLVVGRDGQAAAADNHRIGYIDCRAVSTLLTQLPSVRLALKFSTSLLVTVSVIAYVDFENVIDVDRDRNVVFDFWSINSDEIDSFLKARLKDFDGVFSVDTLPGDPRLSVCNTDPSDKPGRHWIAIYVDENGRGDFFDSFGRLPNVDFELYINRHCSSWNFNDKQLQGVVSKFS